MFHGPKRLRRTSLLPRSLDRRGYDEVSLASLAVYMHDMKKNTAAGKHAKKMSSNSRVKSKDRQAGSTRGPNDRSLCGEQLIVTAYDDVRLRSLVLWIDRSERLISRYLSNLSRLKC